ncbi:efflux RND transporter periplasmic adaptor subunit [Lutibacter flavus]|uniref:HlyD family secretion protein n=1 Tax=Lutibacter flavus TaxID=691689 RepID=A0A238XKC9_9FLAO|nr:efflux RND transporter periplasmic adaptor subunit [Lutibacter flavus]SNR59476.1 HlyD family secretion protein [Lutibacter flavus]
MKKYRWILIGLLIIVAGVYFYYKPKLEAKNLEFTYTKLEKGAIEAIVSSTGTLEAINTVEVGTQISGTIKKIYADYNDEVKAGQLLAEMDLKLLNTNLISAQANLAVSKTQLEHSKKEYERNLGLFDKNVISEKDLANFKYIYDQAKGVYKAAEAAVKNIQVSIGYARITSPINGTITERSVEEGQTVAASFATPRMFIIAEDLSKMQILADVDESDIGYIRDSMRVRFTVQTFSEKDFYGIVSQIRLQPIEINNVVNYQVVVDVDNKKGLLLPGMTTSLEFITNTAKDVFLINNSALRFRPNEVMLKEIKSSLEENSKSVLSDSLYQKFKNSINNEESYTPGNFKKVLPSNINIFFYTNSDGKLDFKFIETGIKTGLQSQIIRFLDGSQLSEEIKAINGIKSKK